MTAADTIEAIADEDEFWVHFTSTHTVAIPHDGHRFHTVLLYGSELLITPEIIEASRDKNGRSFLLERIESGTIHRGRWPEGKLRLQPGSFEFNEARDAAIAAAHALPEKERAVARAKIRQDFGAAPLTSKTIATIKGDARG